MGGQKLQYPWLRAIHRAESVTTQQHLPQPFATVQVQPQEDILQHCQLLKQGRELESPHQATRHNLMRFEATDILTVEIMVPAVGGKKPLSRLKQVVFPAPFGPIRPTISPASTVMSTRLTAASPPKCLVRLCASRRAIASPLTSALSDTATVA